MRAENLAHPIGIKSLHVQAIEEEPTSLGGMNAFLVLYKAP
jgi:hypothetical protein